jgi:hypothetical protein
MLSTEWDASSAGDLRNTADRPAESQRQWNRGGAESLAAYPGGPEGTVHADLASWLSGERAFSAEGTIADQPAATGSLSETHRQSGRGVSD